MLEGIDRSGKEYLTLVQRALNELTFGRTKEPALITDGIFGRRSYDMLNTYQALQGLPKTRDLNSPIMVLIDATISYRFITQKYIESVARSHRIEPAMIFSLMKKESMGSGFLANGRTRILFERHKFYQYLSQAKPAAEFQRMAAANPDIISRTAGGYKGGDAEWLRLTRAMELDTSAAMMSASWGLGQVMGFNWKIVGAKSVEDLYGQCQLSEKHQLDFLMGFIVNQPTLHRAFQTRDYATIGRLYNGANYAKNNYDKDLRTFYDREPAHRKTI